tara:strand:- start:130759 stop:130929 length:171 start_codon:yes stop_codon:yes gene_type:complete
LATFFKRPITQYTVKQLNKIQKFIFHQAKKKRLSQDRALFLIRTPSNSWSAKKDTD